MSTERLLTWGDVRKAAEHLPDSAPVWIEDGNFDCVGAGAAKACTHKDAHREHVMLYEAHELEELAAGDVKPLPEPALVIILGGTVAFHHDDLPMAEVA